VVHVEVVSTEELGDRSYVAHDVRRRLSSTRNETSIASRAFCLTLVFVVHSCLKHTCTTTT